MSRFSPKSLRTALKAQPQNPDLAQDEAMGIALYVDDDDGYRDWLKRNPRGYVINIQRSLNPSDARLHDANCRDLIAQLRRDVQLAVSYVKVCGEDRAEVDQWAADNVGEPVQLCGHCHDVDPGPDPDAPRPLCPNCFIELPVTGTCANCD